MGDEDRVTSEARDYSCLSVCIEIILIGLRVLWIGSMQGRWHKPYISLVP